MRSQRLLTIVCFRLILFCIGEVQSTYCGENKCLAVHSSQLADELLWHAFDFTMVHRAVDAIVDGGSHVYPFELLDQYAKHSWARCFPVILAGKQSSGILSHSRYTYER